MRQEIAPYQKSLPQLCHAVKLAIKLHPLGGDAPAIDALKAARNQTEKADIRSRLSTMIKIAEDIQANDLIPEAFGPAIDFLCRRANYQPHDLAKHAGVEWSMHDWRRGRHAPNRFLGYGPVKKMEELLGCAPGTLWERVRYRSSALGTIPKQFWPIEIPKDAAIRKEIKFYLPDNILTLPKEESHELFLTAYGVVLSKRLLHVDSNHAANTADKYRHARAKWCPMLRDDVRRLFKFRSFKLNIEFNGKTSGILWVKGTKERNQAFIEKIMGVLLRENASFKADDLTLALLTIPTLSIAAIEFTRARRLLVEVKIDDKDETEVGDAEQVEKGPVEVHPYERDDIQLLVLGKAMVAEDGFLRQHPEFYGNLSPEARKMLADEHPEAGDDWNAICDAAELKYETAIKEIEIWLKALGPRLSRPKARIVQILENDPHDFRAAFGAVLASKLKKCEEGYSAWVYATQNLVYHEMVSQFPHRSRAIREATYLPDQRGSLRCVNGEWQWHTHWTLIKNARATGLFKDTLWHVGVLKDTNGLYKALHNYTKPGGARDWLLKERPTDRLFVTNSDTPELDARKLYKKVSGSSLYVLALIDDERWSETRCYGPHADRKIEFNAALEPADSPNAEIAYLRACGRLLINPNTASIYYEYSKPADRAIGTADKLEAKRQHAEAKLRGKG